jgi:adhesin transport system membrane fusion protein
VASSFDVFSCETRGIAPSMPVDLVPRSRALRVAGRLVVVVFVLVIGALVFAPWQQSVRGGGRVIAFAPLERQQEIKAPIAGRVVDWHVQEGQHVEEGQPIATISDNDPGLPERLARARDAARERLDAARHTGEVLAQQISALETARTASVSAARERVDMARSRLTAAEQAGDAAIAAKRAADLQLTRTRALAGDGLTSTRSLELAELAVQTADADVARARAAIAAARAEVQSLRAEQTRTDAAMVADVERVRASLQAAKAEVANADGVVQEREVALARQATMRVVAPRAGAILRQVAKQGGEYVSAGDAIAVLVPSTEARAVELLLEGRDGPLVTPGRHVRLQFEGWPAVQFVGWPSVAVGTFGGVVAFVDAAADASGKFRVVVVPDPHDEPWPDSQNLRQGVRVKGWVLLERVRLGFELWRQWNGFPPATEPAPSKPPATKDSP